jgi:hypothetical protein
MSLLTLVTLLIFRVYPLSQTYNTTLPFGTHCEYSIKNAGLAFLIEY